MKECKKGRHKYLYQLKGNRHLLNEYKEFSCIKCGLNWRYDDSYIKIDRIVRNNVTFIKQL